MNAEKPRLTVAQIAKSIDHSLLHPTMTDAQVRAGLEIARRCQCATACVKPYSVPLATSLLTGSGVGVCAVAGFPHGNNHTSSKIAEATLALDEGATEIDVVANIGKVLSDDWTYVADEIGAINAACTSRGAILKVIFENDYLKETQIIRLCEICTEQQVAFVKTSSGYGFVRQPNGDYNYKGATDEHLRLMRRHSGPKVQVKAAGGVRSLSDLIRVASLGVTRIGATATEAILNEAASRGFVGESKPGPSTTGPVETGGY